MRIQQIHFSLPFVKTPREHTFPVSPEYLFRPAVAMGVWEDVNLKMDVTLHVCLTYGEPSIPLSKMYCLFAGLLLKHSWHAHVSEHLCFQFPLLPRAVFGFTASQLKPLLQAHLFSSATGSGPRTVTLAASHASFTVCNLSATSFYGFQL